MTEHKFAIGDRVIYNARHGGKGGAASALGDRDHGHGQRGSGGALLPRGDAGQIRGLIGGVQEENNEIHWKSCEIAGNNQRV